MRLHSPAQLRLRLLGRRGVTEHREGIIDGLVACYHAVPQPPSSQEVRKKRAFFNMIALNIIIVNSEIIVLEDGGTHRYRPLVSEVKMKELIESRVNASISSRKVAGLMREVQSGKWLGKKRLISPAGRTAKKSQKT